MSFKIPGKDKRFVVDNASMTRGNVHSTFNIMFDADVGRIKLNPPMTLSYSEADNNDFTFPYAIVNAQKNGGGGVDTYILTYKNADFSGVWSTVAGLTKLTGTNAPSTHTGTYTAGDMCIFPEVAGSAGIIHVSDSAGLHYVDSSASAGNWTPKTDNNFKNCIALVPFKYQNRLYCVKPTLIDSCLNDYVLAGSGSYTQIGLSGVSCARAATKRIWYAASSLNAVGNSLVYEWDGVNTNPLNIYTLNTNTIQAMAILNDLPYVIDGRGRLWTFNGYTFVIVANLPSREDDLGTSSKTVDVFRNGMITDKGKIYILVGSPAQTNPYPNTTERCLSGIWCYDPAIGLYHYSSPENLSAIYQVLALSAGSVDKTYIAGYLGSVGNYDSATSRVARTETTGGLSGTLRRGYIITQFAESKNLTDIFNTIAVKYRDMIYSAASIEVKYRLTKNIECNAAITWTSATTFTCTTATLAGTGSTYNTQVVAGDEVMVQAGNNVGLIAHITKMSDAGGTTTVTIDRSATTTSGTSQAMFSNFTFLEKIIPDTGVTFKKINLGKKATMVQVKLVLEWKGYFDEVQEILINEEREGGQT